MNEGRERGEEKKKDSSLSQTSDIYLKNKC